MGMGVVVFAKVQGEVMFESLGTPKLESVQDFVIKLDMHLVEISIFSLNLVQTYQNYEQSRQKLGTILEIKYVS